MNWIKIKRTIDFFFSLVLIGWKKNRDKFRTLSSADKSVVVFNQLQLHTPHIHTQSQQIYVHSTHTCCFHEFIFLLKYTKENSCVLNKIVSQGLVYYSKEEREKDRVACGEVKMKSKKKWEQIFFSSSFQTKETDTIR